MSVIVIRPQTIEEGFEHTIRVVQDLTFDKKYGYKTIIPDNKKFIQFCELGHSKYKTKLHFDIFEKEIWNINKSAEIIKYFNKHKKIILECVDKLEKMSDILFFESYEIHIVKYGVGGEYIIENNKVILQIQNNGETFLAPPAVNPIEKAVRLIILSAIDDIVEKYKFSHPQKMAIHDAIFLQVLAPVLSKHFPDDKYTTWQHHDQELFGLTMTDGVENLMQTIEHYVSDRKQKEQDLIDLLVEYGMTDNEAKTYVQIYKFGELSVATIARLTGIKRTTTHMTLQNMITSGITHKISKNKTDHYRVIDIQTLVHLKEQHIYKLSDKIQSLECIFAPNTNKQKNTNVASYEGVTHIRNLYEQILVSPGSISYWSDNPNYPNEIKNYLQNSFWPKMSKKLKIGENTKNLSDKTDDNSVFGAFGRLYDEIWIVDDSIFCFCFSDKKCSAVVMER